MKTLLGFFGQVIFVALFVIGVGLVLFYFDLTDAPGILQTLVQRVRADVTQTEKHLPNLNFPDLAIPNLTNNPGEIQVTVVGQGNIEKTNLLPTGTEALPIVTMQPEVLNLVPTDVPTPVPPMDPVVYQTEATIRLKRLADALERWLASNDQLMNDNRLLRDPTWRSQVTANLAEVAAQGSELANIGKPPQQYADIDTWLKRAGQETGVMRASYLRALDTGSTQDFTVAADSFTRIKKYLTQAAQLMLAAGWSFDQ